MPVFDNNFPTRWKPGGHTPASGLGSGPLVLFDGTGHTLVVAPFSQFMATSGHYGPDPSDVGWKEGPGVETNLVGDGKGVKRGKKPRDVAAWGVMGTATEIPRDFSMWISVYYSGSGVNKVSVIYK